MAEQTTRKGGRKWFGKTEAKAGGRKTRRQDDLQAVRDALAYQQERGDGLNALARQEARHHLAWADNVVEHARNVKTTLDIDKDNKAYTAIVDLMMIVRLLQLELRDSLDREEAR